MSVVWVTALWVYVLASVVLRTFLGRRNPAYYQTSRSRWYLASILIGTIFALWSTAHLLLTRAELDENAAYRPANADTL